MLRATFLGHQGWLVRGGDTHLLIDPLLGAGFGHGGLVGEIYPPRRLDLAAFPALDAVVLSHEHDDHFDIPSLLRLDRRIPIYFPERASIAGRGLLQALGFTVRPLAPAADHEIGELRLRTFVADHRGADLGDEWEVAPMLLRDVAGDGALASSIDVPPPPAMLAALGELAPRPGIWAHANNTSIDAHQRLGA
ncbi:MAG TPA: MBL fold metallo-hydrolase, partial [Nannocystaceae bacterium]|nr:MBL fold metallo-hydrolase [Nannocystaceae bacterium]